MDEDSCSTQLIYDDGIFNVSGLESFMKTVKLSECGLSYAVVAIIGPEISGKSTLLNHLFHTNFREMDALSGRSQTTKGIWIAKCVGIEPCTIAMDLEGTADTERGEDVTAFAKQSALFALATADILLINIWCHDIGREQAANKPLLRTIFQVLMSLFSPHKTTLLFVIRDKTKTPLEHLERILREDIQEIWDAVSKPEAHMDTPLSEFFIVDVTALSSYEEKEEQFKEQVAQLRRRLFHSIDQGRLARDRRDVTTSDFSFSAQHIWKAIRENKDLDLPAHKVIISTVRCDEIADEKLSRLTSSEDWLTLNATVQSRPVSGFGKKVSFILDAYLSEYDMEAICFDEDVRAAKRRQLESKALHLVHPTYQAMLGHIRSKTLDSFKNGLELSLKKGTGFAASVHDCTRSCMLEFDQGCSAFLVREENNWWHLTCNHLCFTPIDVAIRQSDWDASKARDKLRRDIKAHAASVRSAKLSELVAYYEKQLTEVLAEPVESLFDVPGQDTWGSIRKLLDDATGVAVSEFSTALAGFELDQPTFGNMVRTLGDRAKNVVEKMSREAARSPLIRLKHRFSKVFLHDNDSVPRVWVDGYKDIRAIEKDARIAALRLLSVMAAIRLDGEPDEIENVLLSSLTDVTVASAPADALASRTWEGVSPENTLISPVKCKSLWMRLLTDTEFMVTHAISAQEERRRDNIHLLACWGIPLIAVLGAKGVMRILK
ncbi:protein ROOT HAIR DEFECTIVE 3 homolog 2-like isoform X1 [Tasmannia lanceolata]|uniref:protein ROOT HAIR DEFECTIVE 3 homolog 2-like isoform X1 n=2 Tax=Tasmannia lanceolata TaxID=3420 RepID=UPI004063353A